MAALPASLRVAAMPTPVKCSMPSTPQSEVLSALYEWEMMLKPLACAALEIALKTSPLQSSLRVIMSALAHNRIDGGFGIRRGVDIGRSSRARGVHPRELVGPAVGTVAK